MRGWRPSEFFCHTGAYRRATRIMVPEQAAHGAVVDTKKSHSIASMPHADVDRWRPNRRGVHHRSAHAKRQ